MPHQVPRGRLPSRAPRRRRGLGEPARCQAWFSGAPARARESSMDQAYDAPAPQALCAVSDGDAPLGSRVFAPSLLRSARPCFGRTRGTRTGARASGIGDGRHPRAEDETERSLLGRSALEGDVMCATRRDRSVSFCHRRSGAPLERRRSTCRAERPGPSKSDRSVSFAPRGSDGSSALAPKAMTARAPPEQRAAVVARSCHISTRRAPVRLSGARGGVDRA